MLTIQWIPYFANSGLSSSWYFSPFLQISHDTDMTLFTQSLAGYLSMMVNLFLFFDRDWVAWIKVGCIFIQPLSELVEAAYVHRRSSTGLFKILNYLDCSWTELELFPEEPRNDYYIIPRWEFVQSPHKKNDKLSIFLIEFSSYTTLP